LINEKNSGEILYDLTVSIDSVDNGHDIVILEDGFAFNGISHSGATNTTKLVTGCFKFSTTLSEAEPQEKTDPFLLYPNPSSDVIYIQQSKRATRKNIAQVFNLDGHLLLESPFLEEDRLKINVQDLPSGMYLLKIGNQALKFSIVR
jgi:hypothetical protein